MKANWSLKKDISQESSGLKQSLKIKFKNL